MIKQVRAWFRCRNEKSRESLNIISSAALKQEEKDEEREEQEQEEEEREEQEQEEEGKQKALFKPEVDTQRLVCALTCAAYVYSQQQHSFNHNQEPHDMREVAWLNPKP